MEDKELGYKTILIDGLIGAGKTTLCKRIQASTDCVLSLELGSSSLRETVENYYSKHPYFYSSDYTLDIASSSYSRSLQAKMMGYHCFNQLKNQTLCKALNKTLLLDRGAYSVLIFTAVQYIENILLKDHSEGIFQQFFDLFEHFDPINGFIYYDTDIKQSLENIQKRSRGSEINMSLSYMIALQKVQKIFITEVIDKMDIPFITIPYLGKNGEAINGLPIISEQGLNVVLDFIFNDLSSVKEFDNNKAQKVTQNFVNIVFNTLYPDWVENKNKYVKKGVWE